MRPTADPPYLTSRTEMLAIILGALFVAEVISVVLRPQYQLRVPRRAKHKGRELN
ncbi:hypothetical protein [Mycobacterium sp. DL440]|uniref:hypothetical protein n=1 Tax=Mycobacterium sp. DL440 TaxID=2675523 RepID=UPI00141E0092|nr:hypothetical protein [Mycobacterium sp. DL440]